MPLDPEDKEWLQLTIENAHLKAADAHRKEAHAPLEERVNGLSKRVAILNRWFKTAVVAAAGAFGINLTGGN